MRLVMIVNPNVGDILGMPKRTYYDLYYQLINLGWEIIEYYPESRYWDARWTLADIEKELQPDVIVSWGWVVVKRFMPDGKPKNTPMVCFTGDIHLEPPNFTKFYNKFNLLIHRGPFTKNIQLDYQDITLDVEGVWLPLSVTDEFYPDSAVKRINKIIFMGNDVGTIYELRRLSIQKLSKAKLLINKKYSVGREKYPEEVRKYVGGLTCTGPSFLQQMLCKCLEYGASGTAVLTPWFHRSKELFGGKQCYFEHKDDRSDIVDVAREIIYDKDKVVEVTTNMLKQINRYHRDRHRLKELDAILKALIYGKEIPRRWGI